VHQNLEKRKVIKQLYLVAVNTASRDMSEEARDEADSYMKESRIENAEKP
jgi:hypothetical protein